MSEPRANMRYCSEVQGRKVVCRIGHEGGGSAAVIVESWAVIQRMRQDSERKQAFTTVTAKTW